MGGSNTIPMPSYEVLPIQRVNPSQGPRIQILATANTSSASISWIETHDSRVRTSLWRMRNYLSRIPVRVLICCVWQDCKPRMHPHLCFIPCIISFLHLCSCKLVFATAWQMDRALEKGKASDCLLFLVATAPTKKQKSHKSGNSGFHHFPSKLVTLVVSYSSPILANGLALVLNGCK